MVGSFLVRYGGYVILLHGILDVLNLWDIEELGNEEIQRKYPDESSDTVPAARPLKQKMRIDCD
jgi:hypothetical protein